MLKDLIPPMYEGMYSPKTVDIFCKWLFFTEMNNMVVNVHFSYLVYYLQAVKVPWVGVFVHVYVN